MHPHASPGLKGRNRACVRPGELSIAYAGICAARGKQAPGSPDMPITRRCVCPGIHKPADAKRLYRSAAPSIWLHMAPHTQPDGTSKAIPSVLTFPNRETAVKQTQPGTLSASLPKHNNGSSGNFPPDDPIAPKSCNPHNQAAQRNHADDTTGQTLQSRKPCNHANPPSSPTAQQHPTHSLRSRTRITA